MKDTFAQGIVDRLMDLIDPLCHHCYGRGYEGIRVGTGVPLVCRCVKKKVALLGFRSLDDYMRSLPEEGVKAAREAVNERVKEN